MSFYQKMGSAIYHTNTKCSKVPDKAGGKKGWKSLKSRPKGAKKCPECTNKDKKK